MRPALTRNHLAVALFVLAAVAILSWDLGGGGARAQSSTFADGAARARGGG